MENHHFKDANHDISSIKGAIFHRYVKYPKGISISNKMPNYKSVPDGLDDVYLMFSCIPKFPNCSGLLS
jgi:hypothetical protein